MGTTRRHCWECRRRKLVCDFTIPECKRCQKSGTPCPGYGDQKPVMLRWVETGKIQSRPRKAKPKPKRELAVAKRTQNKDEESSDSFSKSILDLSRTEVSPFTNDLLEACYYFNSTIGPKSKPMLEVAPNFAIVSFPPELVRTFLMAPEYLKLSFVYFSLEHRVRYSDSQSALGPKMLTFRGHVLNSLRNVLQESHWQYPNAILIGILVLLISDVRIGSSVQTWRYHLDAIRNIVQRIGGVQKVCETKAYIPVLIFSMHISVLGDTTSPASHIELTSAHLEDYKFLITEFADKQDFFLMFPAPLFMLVININYLRMHATKCAQSGLPALAVEASAISDSIFAFSPADWVSSVLRSQGELITTFKMGSRQRDLLLIGNIYKQSVALYCISSLQSVSVFPPDLETINLRISCGLHLAAFMQEALLSMQKFEMLVLWPLTVLGAQVPSADTFLRNTIEKYFSMSLSLGGRQIEPHTLKCILRRFWASGNTLWDECFDQSYMLLGPHSIDGRGFLRRHLPSSNQVQ